MSELPDHPCPDWLPLLHGLADDELDAEHALRVEAHVAEHAACAAELARIRQTRATLKAASLGLEAPVHLREKILADLAAASGTRASSWSHLLQRIRAFLSPIEPWSLPASLAVLVVAVGLVSLPRPDTMGLAGTLEAELVAGHVRSLLADHLTDVATSDRHTVKPWFNGRIDFSPPVADLKPQGFPLLGGRVDYVGRRVVAALAFQHDRHVINLFIWPGTAPTVAADERDGYNLTGWTRDGLVFEAVSDLNASELATFAQAFKSASTQ